MGRTERRQHFWILCCNGNNGNPARNVNSFLSLFGEEFKRKISTEIRESDENTESMMAFLTIGSLRIKKTA